MIDSVPAHAESQDIEMVQMSQRASELTVQPVSRRQVLPKNRPSRRVAPASAMVSFSPRQRLDDFAGAFHCQLLVTQPGSKAGHIRVRMSASVDSGNVASAHRFTLPSSGGPPCILIEVVDAPWLFVSR